MRRLHSAFSMFIAVFALASMAVSAIELKEGVHYEVISPKKSADKKIVEYFNYGCGGCFGAEPFVAKLKKNKPEGVSFQSIPFENHPGWKIYVEAYYIAEMLGINEQMHPKIFHRVHIEKKPIADKDQLKEMFVANGVDPKKFDDAISSFQLDVKQRAARQQAIKHKIMSTPSYVINDHYKLKSDGFTSYDEMEKAIYELSKR